MSSGNCKLTIVLGLVGVMSLGVGCTTTRLGSMPKMNLAWWKKDDAAPGTRHDDLAPPSSTLTPTASLATTKPAATSPSTTSQPSRTPYKVEDDAVRVSESPPATRSFELSKQSAVSTPPATDEGAVPVQRKAFGLPNSMPVAGTSPTAPNGIRTLTTPTRQSVAAGSPDDAAKFDDLTNVPRSTPIATDSLSIDTQLPTQTAQTAAPIRVVNPFAADSSAGAPTPQRIPLPTNVDNANALIATETPTGGSVYTRTPYNSFSPKASASVAQVNTTTPAATSPPTNTSPLLPMIPKTADEGIKPPPTLNLPTNPIQTPPATGSSMPDSLLKTQGSYAPGSVRGAQSNNLILPSSKPATSPAAPAPMPILVAPSTSATPAIGGGGSFNFSK